MWYTLQYSVLVMLGCWMPPMGFCGRINSPQACRCHFTTCPFEYAFWPYTADVSNTTAMTKYFIGPPWTGASWRRELGITAFPPLLSVIFITVRVASWSVAVDKSRLHSSSLIPSPSLVPTKFCCKQRVIAYVRSGHELTFSRLLILPPGSR